MVMLQSQVHSLTDLLQNRPEGAELNVELLVPFLERLGKYLDRYWGLSPTDRYLLDSRSSNTVESDLQAAFIALHQGQLWVSKE